MADLLVFALALAIGLYGTFAVLALWLLNLAPHQIPTTMPELARYVALAGPFARGERLAMLIVAIGCYGAAVFALLDRSAASLSLFGAGVCLEAGAFLSWKGRTAFLNGLTQTERASEIVGLLGLVGCLALLCGLRFSGVLS